MHKVIIPVAIKTIVNYKMLNIENALIIASQRFWHIAHMSAIFVIEVVLAVP